MTAALVLTLLPCYDHRPVLSAMLAVMSVLSSIVSIAVSVSASCSASWYTYVVTPALITASQALI